MDLGTGQANSVLARVAFVCALAILGVVAALTVFFNNNSRDFETIFLPSTHRLLSLESPYAVTGFYDPPWYGFFNPPWALLPVAPFTLLPKEVASIGFRLLTIIAYTAVALHITKKLWLTTFFLLSPPIVASIGDGTLDWFPLLGMVAMDRHWPGRTLLFLAKPQTGAGLFIWFVFEKARKQQFRELALESLILMNVFIFSVLLFGFWPSRLLDAPAFPWNTSVFPWTLPLGIIAMYLSISGNKSQLAAMAGPLSSPYVALYSWGGVFLGLALWPRALIYTVLGSWIAILALKLGLIPFTLQAY